MTWMPRPPEVFGHPTRPASVSTSRSVAATARGVGEVGAGLRVEVDAQLVRGVDVRAPDRPGVEVEGAEVRRPGSTAGSVGHSTSAGRPLGNGTCTVST